MKRQSTLLILLALTLCIAQPLTEIAAQPLKLSNGQTICIIGNTLAERMQHDGYLEAMIQFRTAGKNITIRNMGFSADEIDIRLRSANFGSPEKWLTKHKADVVFAMFGYNESFAGAEGLDAFKTKLANWIKQTQTQKFNNSTTPTIVLFSPIAHENLKIADLPDGSDNNKRLALYTKAMKAVANEHKITFVDLFTATEELYEQIAADLTINGVHLNSEGNKYVAGIIDATLFKKSAKPSMEKLEAIRAAVKEKNFFYFNRYRTTDGYSIYGGRAGLKFVKGQTNRTVMQREMEILDVLAENRDKKIWAIVQGKPFKVDDSNTPPFIPVTTNKPGKGPGGKHIFLSGEDSIKKMTVAEGCEVTLFASEEMFPELISPVQMAFDTKGRLWVATWPTYPHWKPKTEMNDRLLILEDTDDDGKADKCTSFAKDLHNPTGFEFYRDGVIVSMAPDLVFLRDTDGDDVADERTRILHGIDSADTHHTANSFTIGPGGALYFQEGTFHHTQIESPHKKPVRSANAGVFRFEPRTFKIDCYVPFQFANPHGHVWDKWGQDIIHDGTSSTPYHGALFSGHLEFPNKHRRPPVVYNRRTRPCPATEYLSSRHFPKEFQDNLIVGNVIGFQGFLRYKVEDDGASFKATELPPLLSSTDPNFRPVDIEVSPRGDIYFVDWQNPIIGHMQHNLRDPSRDNVHGRVYRIRYKNRPLLKEKKVKDESIANLIKLLEEPEYRVRNRAKIELSARETVDVLKEVDRWVAELAKRPRGSATEQLYLEALWMYQYHNVVNKKLLERILDSSEFRVRAAGTRVLCYWRDRVKRAIPILKELAMDQHPRVRLEAVRAASFFTDPEALTIVLNSLDRPSDRYIDFVRGETMRALEPHWKTQLASGKKLDISEKASEFLLSQVNSIELLRLPMNKVVCRELLRRAGITDEIRTRALAKYSELIGRKPTEILLEAIGYQDNSPTGPNVVYDLGRLLTMQSQAELKASRDAIVKLAMSGKRHRTRQIGLVAMVSVDGNVEPAWKATSGSAQKLNDLLTAMPVIPDPNIRAQLYPKFKPLVTKLPDGLISDASKATSARYVRIELPGNRRILTLAEVQVFSNGENVARKGKASQSSTAYNGNASRAIDNNTSGTYGDNGQTHTRESTRDPWWQVDLGRDFPIEKIVVFNRTDGNLSSRLNNFTIRLLDGDKKEVYRKERIAAPKVSQNYNIGPSFTSAGLQSAAIVALTYVRGQEKDVFATVSPLIADPKLRPAAVRALQRIAPTYYDKTKIPALLDQIVKYVSAIPKSKRTATPVLDALDVGNKMAALLPPADAKKMRAKLGELGVRIVRIGTRPHRMLYDKDIIAVQAGKQVQIVFENNDIMPHNLVITQPGALVEIGELAEEKASDRQVIRRGYVPRSNKVILGSKLLQPQQIQKINFKVPTKPGVYPYVCTYPGHWRRMYGALYVVADLDAYLASPEKYIAANPLPIKDDMLKNRRPRTEWKFADLKDSVRSLGEGRSFETGKQMFTVANCIACHKMDGKGKEFGPDLTQYDKKWTTEDILREIVEPSHRINEKYFTYKIETESGEVITGLIIKETPDYVDLVENPLVKTEPRRIKKTDIFDRAKSKVSLMPKGMVDQLTEEEILDLVAYLAARGKKNSKMFGSGHHHGSSGTSKH